MKQEHRNILTNLDFHYWLANSETGKHLLYNIFQTEDDYVEISVYDIFDSLPLSLQVGILVEFIFEKYEQLLIVRSIKTHKKSYSELIEYQLEYIFDFLKKK